MLIKCRAVDRLFFFLFFSETHSLAARRQRYLLSDELFVCYMKKPKISGYNKDTFSLQRTGSVPGWGCVEDMASCQRHQCVYISDWKKKAVHRVDNNNQITQWSVDDEPFGLSVNSTFNVLVTCHEVGKIKEFTTDCKLTREISLQSDITNPSQAIQLANYQVVVCHGRSDDEIFHRVCTYSQ